MVEPLELPRYCVTRRGDVKGTLGRGTARWAAGLAGVESGAIGGPFLASAGGKRLADAGVIGTSGARVLVLEPLLTDLVARSVLSVSADDC